MKIHLCLALTLFIAGCGALASMSLTQANLDKIHDDMTPTEVKAILGDPAESKSDPRDKGVYRGYVKSFFYHLEFEPKSSDEGNPGAIWSGVLNTVKGLFESDKQVIATQSELSGRVDQLQVDSVSLIMGILSNAYIQALCTGFDPTHAPALPADTVTTPLSESTQKEAAQPSPAAKNK